MKNSISIVWDITCKVCRKTFEQVSRGKQNAHRLYCGAQCRKDAYKAKIEANRAAIELRRAQEEAERSAWVAMIRDRTDLSSTCKLVSFVIWSFVNANGWAKKSLAEIGTASGLNRRTVIVAVQYLEKLGLLEITRQREIDGGKASHQYRILMKNAAIVANTPVEKQMRLCG